jgi:hypothetical protein
MKATVIRFPLSRVARRVPPLLPSLAGLFIYSSSYVKLVGLRRPKDTSSLSCAKYRLKTNVVILCDMVTVRKGLIQEE